MRGSRRTRLTLVLLLLTAFTFTALDYNSGDSGPLASLRRGIDTVFGPVTRAVGGAASSVGSALGGLPRLGSYQSENKKLQRENDRLRGIIASQTGAQCELDQYRALEGLVQYTKYPSVPAHVVAVGASSEFEWTATIDVGSVDGIKKDMTVVTGAGLVGRTTDVRSHTSRVLLISDPQIIVGGSLVNISTPGFVSGRGSKPMLFSLPSTKQTVKKGTVLLTTGSGTYVAGIPIGTLLSITPDTNALTRTAEIAPFVDVSHLGLVGVITTARRTAPRQPFLPRAPGASPTSSPCPAAVPQGPVPTFSPTPSPTPVVTVSPSTTPTP